MLLMKLIIYLGNTQQLSFGLVLARQYVRIFLENSLSINIKTNQTKRKVPNDKIKQKVIVIIQPNIYNAWLTFPPHISRQP